MLKKAYLYLKNDIEKEKTIILIIEVIVFVLLWTEFWFLYFTQPIHEIYLYASGTSPVITAEFLTFLSAIFLFLFIISSFCIGELIHRTRKRIAHNKLLKSQKGWLLIDSLLGLVIFSTATIGLLLAFTQATKGTIASTNRTQATYLAQQTLENLKAQNGKSAIDTTVVSPVGIYTIAVATPPVKAITGDTNNLGTYLKPYQVTVTWSDASGGPASKSVKMVGYCYVNPSQQ